MTASGWAPPARSSTSPTTWRLRPTSRPDLVPWLAFAHQKLERDRPAHPRPGPRTGRRGRGPGGQRRVRPRAGGLGRRDPADGPPPRGRPHARPTPSAHVPYERRRAVQQRGVLALPLLPTTTIGSFPQTTEIRAARRRHAAGRALSDDGLPGVLPGGDRPRHRPAGGPRPRRPRPRRARTQRHGPVLRRTARRLRHHQPRLGPDLRHPLRPAPHPLRRRRAPAGADDRRLVHATPSPSPTDP